MFHQRTGIHIAAPQKISRRTSDWCVHLIKKKIGLLFSQHAIKELRGLYCSATYRPLWGYLQSQHENGCSLSAEMIWQNFWWLTFNCLTFLSHCLLPSGHHNLLNHKKKKNQNKKDFGWSTSTAHIFCKGWLAGAACQLVVVTQKSWFLAALRDLLSTMA